MLQWHLGLSYTDMHAGSLCLEAKLFALLQLE